MKYIFRWKSGGIEVRPSEGDSVESVWAWAIENLRPCDMEDDAEAEQFIRANGEVVEVVE